MLKYLVLKMGSPSLAYWSKLNIIQKITMHSFSSLMMTPLFLKTSNKLYWTNREFWVIFWDLSKNFHFFHLKIICFWPSSFKKICLKEMKFLYMMIPLKSSFQLLIISNLSMTLKISKKINSWCPKNNMLMCFS